jgi:hypothetical protein
MQKANAKSKCKKQMQKANAKRKYKEKLQRANTKSKYKDYSKKLFGRNYVTVIIEFD